jgi:hypothetical protein
MSRMSRFRQIGVTTALLPCVVLLGCGNADSVRMQGVGGGIDGGSAESGDLGDDSRGDDGASGDVDAGIDEVSVAADGGASRDVDIDVPITASGSCAPAPACDMVPPDPGPKRDFRHTLSSITASLGSPNHRGRDLFLNVGDPQWIIGKFAYGVSDKDLKDEEVDLYLARGCSGPWEKLGTSLTTEENAHATVEGVDDSGGRVYFEIPPVKALGPGRHRVRMVVAGDLSATDVFLEIVPPHTPVFVSDVDGTLTTSENEEFTALLGGTTPVMNAEASNALGLLAERGYRPLYLTARPEFLVQHTRQFLVGHGFPPGVVHTTLTLTGATGAGAAAYKTAELADLAGKGLVPTFAFGNTDTDAEAYENASIPAAHRFFFQFTDTRFGGRRIEAYTELLGEFRALPSATCP